MERFRNAYQIVREELGTYLDAVRLDVDRIASRVRTLEEAHGIEIYAELMHQLGCLHFEPTLAKAHWQRVLEHRAKMSRRLKFEVDLRVALLNYILQLNETREDPSVVAIQISQRSARSNPRDDLTGFYTLSHFLEELDREIDLSERSGRSLSVAAFDVDNFDPFIDQFGRLAADRFLEAVSWLIVKHVRDGDRVGRVGSAQFLLMLVGTTRPEAVKVCERLVSGAQDLSVLTGDTTDGLTMSAGVASYRSDARTAPGLIDAAQQALYRAKSSGPGQVALASDENREYRRLSVTLEGTIRLFSETGEQVITENLSARGIQLRTTVPIEPGQFFHFRLELPDGEPVEGIGCSRRKSQRSDGWVIGAHITEISSEDERRLRVFIQELEGTPVET